MQKTRLMIYYFNLRVSRQSPYSQVSFFLNSE